jgi:hypothetical protein
MVTHLDVSAQQIEQAIARAGEALAAVTGG